MLRNYFKLAIKILARKKFFTFISLFGISLTLAIVMLVFAFVDSEIGKNPPISAKDKLLIIPEVTLRLFVNDTVWTADTAVVDGVQRIDSTFIVNLENRSTSTSSGSFHLFDRYLRNISNASKYSFFSLGHADDLFRNTQKITLKSIYCDQPYWQIFDFQWKEGRALTANEIADQKLVAVISERGATAYFGQTTGVVGQSVEIDDKVFEVVGLVEDVSASKSYLSADLYLPYTHLRPQALNDDGFQGSFEAIFMASSPGRVGVMRDEIVNRISKIELPDPTRYNRLEAQPLTLEGNLAQNVFRHDSEFRSIQIVLAILTAFLLLLIALPTLNLININVTRIMERSSEIGVRKAFGATQKHLFNQFIFENIILTGLGGVLGYVFARLLIYGINSTGVLEDAILIFNGRVLLYSIAICFAFGLLSGIIPALRMSRMQIVDSLNSVKS